MFRRCFNPQYKYPTDVNGLVSWLKADSDVTFNIPKKTASQWLDQTSNNNDVSQLTELSKPLRYGFDGASDKSKITFNGKSQYFESNNNMPITGNDFSIFHVAKCEQLPTTLSQSIISYKDTDGDEEIRNGDFSEIGAENILNGDFSEIGPEEVLNGDFSEEGAEEVTNGDFANDLDDWTSYGITSATGGIATIGANANSGIFQNTLTNGKSYTVTINVTSYDGVGSAQVANNNGSILYTITTTGIQTFTFKHNIASGNLLIRGISNALFSVSSVSVKEVGQDWTLGTGWSIGDSVAVADGTNNADIRQSGSIVGKYYKLTFTITENNAGRLNVYIGGVFAGQTTNGATGDFTFYAKATDTNLIRIRSNNSFNGSITNISIKEVGQDWSLSGDWTVSNEAVESVGTTSSFLVQSGVVPLSVKNYQLTYEIVTTNNGLLRISGGNSAFGNVTLSSAVGVHTVYLQSNGTKSNLQIWNGTAFIGSIDNISLKEVGQDWSFGSGWNISGDGVIHDGNSNSNIAQNIPLIIGDSYIVTYTVVDASAGSQVGIAPSGTTIQTIRTTTGTYTEIFTAEAVSLYIRSLWNNGNPVSLQNISIRESKSDKLNIGVGPSGRIQFKVLDDNGNEARIISDSSELATSNHIISSRVHNHKLHLQYNNNTEIKDNFPQYSNDDGFNITTFRIGSILDGLAENHFNGDIQEIIIYNKYLDDYERDMVKNYLNNKYNIY